MNKKGSHEKATSKNANHTSSVRRFKTFVKWTSVTKWPIRPMMSSEKKKSQPSVMPSADDRHLSSIDHGSINPKLGEWKQCLGASVDKFTYFMFWSMDDVILGRRKMGWPHLDLTNHRWSTMESPDPNSMLRKNKVSVAFAPACKRWFC